MVLGFDRGPDGATGECEEDGRIRENDILEAINGISLEGRSLRDILLQISRVLRESVTKVLKFRTPAMSKALVIPLVEGAGADADTINDDMAAVTGTPTVMSSSAPSSSSLSAAQSAPLAGNGKIMQFRALLKETLINEGRLRNLASQGLPDKLSLRGVVWRLLLKYLPLETELWPQFLEEQRAQYAVYQRSYIYTPSSPISACSAAAGAAGTPVSPPEMLKAPVSIGADDDPLRNPDESAWTTYYQDTALMDEIQKDVVRTHPDINFFNSDPQGSCQAVMQRILFVYAKKEPMVRYVQGMNELCGTLYYVFASDEDEEWSRHAEADTYHCFSLLVEEMQDVFIRQKDSTESGIIGRIKQFVILLKRHDAELHDLLDLQGVDPAFYGLRWLTTILSREFNLADTIRLWDTLFADTNRNEFLSYLCCAMILEQRERLLRGDFAENLSLLQDYPEIDTIYLLNKATMLRAKDSTSDEDMFLDSGAVSGADLPHLRVLSSLKSAALQLRDSAGTSLSEIKLSAAMRLANVSVGMLQMINEGRETITERVGRTGTWWLDKKGGKEKDELLPF